MSDCYNHVTALAGRDAASRVSTAMSGDATGRLFDQSQRGYGFSDDIFRERNIAKLVSELLIVGQAISHELLQSLSNFFVLIFLVQQEPAKCGNGISIFAIWIARPSAQTITGKLRRIKRRRTGLGSRRNESSGLILELGKAQLTILGVSVLDVADGAGRSFD
jgi:hypothetical protein